MTNVASSNDAFDRAKEPQSIDSLRDLLDQLWQQYLGLVDEYQTARKDLAHHLSAGYLSLAQANFSNPNHIRYNKDYYDERMQASTIVECTQSAFSIISSTSRKIGSTERTSDISGDHAGVESEKDRQHSTGDASPSDSKFRASNPLFWYGILVPPALRASQSSFFAAITGETAILVSVDRKMKDVEIEIRRTRKRISRLG